MFINTTLDAVLEQLGDPSIECDDVVVPAETRDPGHSNYRPGYEWLFFYERALARTLDRWLQAQRPRLYGSRGIISEALSNAFCHGNKRDPRLPIRVTVRVGRAGVLISIEDSGSGFDVDGIIAQAQRGRQYAYHNAGNGLRAMSDADGFGVFFDRHGRRCHILYLKRLPAVGRQD